MKKKLLILFFVVAMMVLAFASCGDDEEATPGSNNNGGDTTSSTAAVVGGDKDCVHDFKSTEKVDATCVATGKEIFKCSKCSATKEEVIEKSTEHKYKFSETEPTCQEKGKIIGVCEYCGDTTETEGKPKTGHTGAEVILSEPTCDTKGSKDWVCTGCGESVYKKGFEKEIPALGHSYENSEDMFAEDAGVTFVAGTCGAEGFFARVCKTCGYDEDPITREEYGKMVGQPGYDSEKYDAMESFGHNFTQFVKSVDSTCTEGSYDQYKCEWCEETENRVTGYALGHTYTKDESAVEGTHYVIEPKPTCMVTGKKAYKCTVCGEVATDDADIEIIPTIEHDTSNRSNQYLKDNVAATCSVAAYKVYKCCVDPLCEETETVYEGEALGHDWQVSGEQTCKTEGKTPYECARTGCGETKLDGPVDTEIKHVYLETVKAATCINDAVYKCKICDSEYAPYDGDTAGKAHGNHVLVYSETVAPTCSTIGYNIYKCSVDEACTVSGKNTDVNNLDVPKAEDIVARTAHNFDSDDNGIIDVTPDGRVVCTQCFMQYRDVSTEITTGGGSLCLGCDVAPACKCGATTEAGVVCPSCGEVPTCGCGLKVEWNGYVSPSDPDVLAAGTEFVKTETIWTETVDTATAKPLAIGEGLIILDGEASTIYTIKVYDKVNGTLLDTIEVSGDVVLVDLYEYAEVGQVAITASTVAVVYFYALVK